MEKITLEDLQKMDFDEEENVVVDKHTYRNYSKDIAFTLGFLLGVKEEHLLTIVEDEDAYNKLIEKLNSNNSAKIIRALNNIRTNLMLHFKRVSQTIRVTSSSFLPLYQMEDFKDDFKALRRLDAPLSTSGDDINKYIKEINESIVKRIDDIKALFPDWVEFKHIRHMFVMPTADIKAESERFQANQNAYPYKRYFYWAHPEEQGNILLTDVKILDIIYKNNGTYFEDLSRVIDASDAVKDNINDFINAGRKIQIFIDGENVDPYRFVSTIDSLKDHEIEKIDKIVVYYDSFYSSRAWTMLKHFTYDIDVETIAVERIKEDKSLVDHKLVAGVAKAVYKEDVDSVIIASSDSDFWSVIQDVEANYLVMVETDKCSPGFKSVLRSHDVFYCYLDNFMTQENNLFFKTVFRKELSNVIEAGFSLGNAKQLLEEAILRSRADVSDAEKDSIFDKYIKGLRLVIDKDGNFKIDIPD